MIHNLQWNCSVAEFDQSLRQIKEELQDRIYGYDERVAIQREHIDDSDAATTQRAIEALQRAERFSGEHDVARAWLRECAPHVGIFRRETA